MACLFLQLFAMNFVLGSWVYDQTDVDQLNTIRGDGWQQDDLWMKFIFWLHLEAYVFMGMVASGIVFMFLRAFYKNQVQIKEETDTASATTDHLEANRIILEINDSNFTPLFASILLVSDVYYNPTSDVKVCVDFFFLG